MRTQATGEQAVAVADMHDVIDVATGIPNAARKAIAPAADVGVGVAGDGRDARRTAGHVNLLHVLARYGKELVRIGVSHVLLGGEGSLSDLLERLDGIRVEAGLVKGLLVELDVLVAVDERLLHALELQGLELAPLHVGDFVLVCHTFLPS